MKHIFYLSLIFFTLNIKTEFHYHSQWGQDKFAHEKFFKNKKNGFFIDIGAYDGITNSNTYFFEHELGWSGICIEPNPNVFEKLQKSRSSLCIHGCVADFSGPAHFLKVQGYCEQLSGLLKKYDERHLQRLENELKEFGGSKEVIPMFCFRLNELLEKLEINHVDYLSIDTEGGELEIIKFIDFSNVTIDVIDIENNYHDDSLKQFLTNQGYEFVDRIKCDEIYKRKQIYSN